MKSRTGLNRTCLTFCNLKFLQQVYEKSDKFESNVSDFCTMCSRPVSNMFTKHVQLFCQSSIKHVYGQYFMDSIKVASIKHVHEKLWSANMKHVQVMASIKHKHVREKLWSASNMFANMFTKSYGQINTRPASYRPF
ncbi:hypothetical protein SlsnVgp131 [Spodoptera littoralis nucleopolyhedrovirus]|uniref:Uncharacterized protein n=1 Tax=Spodoptera littoralis nuclear polyhedrosis virus TaxID=10456 RepID=M1K408_NPVSL|nr:hypothetical protein SlsnVgp131 [Spodoptera littoralis nucleopolyhedrovirus]AGE89986.1 hypothetical protein SlsnVgp131 [Spodoptera littoralis nucleopolyhedrovirus]